MTTPGTHIDLAPSAARLVESLRDTGYSREAAFADIIDNAIAANATHITLEITNLFGPRIAFLDNGHGMNFAELQNALKYGSDKRPNGKSLGKFGMGLKTASTAFCKRLTVISIKNEEIAAGTWDLDDIVANNRWLLEKTDLDQYEDDVDSLKKLLERTESASGTIVIWEKLDRLVPNDNTKKTAAALEQLEILLKKELSAVYANFLDDNCSEFQNISLNIKNDNTEYHLEPWDPLCRQVSFTTNGVKSLIPPSQKITAILPNGQGSSFTITGGIIPNKPELTTEEEKLVRYSLENQGLYIYREGRLIWHGGWPQRMYQKESKMTRLRVVLNFSHELDDLFEIDIRKSRISIPADVRLELKKLIAPWRNAVGKQVPTPNGNGSSPRNPTEIHTPSSTAIEKHDDTTKLGDITIDDSGTAKVRNKNHMDPVELTNIEIHTTDIRILEKPDLPNGSLWDCGLNEEGKIIVKLNQTHPFFRCIYDLCKKDKHMTIGLDMILWALANAEMGNFSPKYTATYENFRIDTSRTLADLCIELPEPSEN